MKESAIRTGSFGANMVLYVALIAALAALVLLFGDAGSKVAALTGTSFILSLMGVSLYATAKLTDRINELTRA